MSGVAGGRAHMGGVTGSRAHMCSATGGRANMGSAAYCGAHVGSAACCGARMGSDTVGETAMGKGVLVMLRAASGGVVGELVGALVISSRLRGPSCCHLLGEAERIDRGLLFHHLRVFSDGVAVETGRRFICFMRSDGGHLLGEAKRAVRRRDCLPAHP